MQDGELTNEFSVKGQELEDFLSELSNMQKTISEATGDIRSRIKVILDQQGYHKKALAVVRSINAMSETQRADFLRTFIPMMEAMRDLKWDAEGADMIGGLDEEPEAESTAVETAPEPDMEAESTTVEGLEDFNGGGNVESLHGDVA